MILHDVSQNSEEWYALRAGIPTASEFSKLVTSTGEPSKSLSGYAVTLAGEKYAGKPLDAFQGTQWTDRGKEMEAGALAYYEFVHDVEIDRVGFVTDDAKSMGCSPDGLIGLDGMIEVKCLKAENHITTIQYYQKHHKCPTTYVQQVQGQMMICERDWCDLIFYHPDLPSFVIRQTPDVALMQAIAEQVPAVSKLRDAILADIKTMEQNQ